MKHDNTTISLEKTFLELSDELLWNIADEANIHEFIFYDKNNKKIARIWFGCAVCNPNMKTSQPWKYVIRESY